MNNQKLEQAMTLRDEGYSLQQIADKLGMSKTSVFRLLSKETVSKSNTMFVSPDQKPDSKTYESLFDANKDDSFTSKTVKNHQTSPKTEVQAAILLSRYQSIVTGILDQINKVTWKLQDFKSCLDQLNRLASQLEYYSFQELAKDHEDLQIWNNLVKLKKIVSDSIKTHENVLFPLFDVVLQLGRMRSSDNQDMKELKSLD